MWVALSAAAGVCCISSQWVAVGLTHSLVSQQFSANLGCQDLAVSHPREVGMSSTAAPPTFGTLQQQTPALPGQPVPAHQPTQPPPSLAMPVACGPPLHSAAQSGPATSAVPFHSPLQQTRCPASASWARKTPPLPTLLPPLLQLTTWDRPTTPGGYGAPQSEEEALTLGLIRTSLMKIKIKQKTKVGAPHLDHDMPVSKTSSKALTAVASLSPSLLFAGQACSTRSFQIFLAIMIL